MSEQESKSEGKQMEASYGQKLVGISFNPGGNSDVDRCKQQYANIIDDLDAKRKIAFDNKDSESIRHFSIAITEAQTAQMWAVKAITWKS